MIIEDREVITEWRINDVMDFIKTFGIEEKIKKLYDIKCIDEIWDAMPSDQDVIFDYLRNDKRNFEIEEIADNNIGCYWIVKEVAIELSLEKQLENYVNYFTSDEKERKEMYLNIKDYVEEVEQ